MAVVIALARALVYAAVFIGFVLVYLPGRVLAAAGVSRPVVAHPVQWIGLVVAAIGAALALWCVATFALVGKGTPAPFDPPRRLVRVGPYRRVRNPMYVGATLALLGATLVYRSLALLAFTGGFLLATHLFVVLYEEPVLSRTFGDAYETYCRETGRWWPRRRAW